MLNNCTVHTPTAKVTTVASKYRSTIHAIASIVHEGSVWLIQGYIGPSCEWFLVSWYYSLSSVDSIYGRQQKRLLVFASYRFFLDTIQLDNPRYWQLQIALAGARSSIVSSYATDFRGTDISSKLYNCNDSHRIDQNSTTIFAHKDNHPENCSPDSSREMVTALRDWGYGGVLCSCNQDLSSQSSQTRKPTRLTCFLFSVQYRPLVVTCLFYSTTSPTIAQA